jgi:hypothetical protein
MDAIQSLDKIVAINNETIAVLEGILLDLAVFTAAFKFDPEKELAL